MNKTAAVPRQGLRPSLVQAPSRSPRLASKLMATPQCTTRQKGIQC
jgi:hypothetical protein